MNEKTNSLLSIKIESRSSTEYCFVLKGNLSVNESVYLWKEFEKLIKDKKNIFLTLDLNQLEFIDSSGAATLASIADRIIKSDGKFLLNGLNDRVKKVLSGFPLNKIIDNKEEGSFFGKIGNVVIDFFSLLGSMSMLVGVTFKGAFILPFKGKFIKWEQFVKEATRIGVDSLPIVGLIGLLLGLIMAFQSAYQLRQFGANIYVANLVGISMVRELGPLMTAIILAGRSGASMTAELGTMKVREEIDALKVMGIEPTQYLIIPKFYAMTITGPSLTLMASAIGIFGGFVIALFYLDLSLSSYWNQTLEALSIHDLLNGMSKSLVFSWIIVIIGCYKGINLTGGAEAVGRATTASVVSSIFMIIIADSLFTTASTVIGG